MWDAIINVHMSALLSVRPSDRPQGTTRHSLAGLFKNTIFELFSKIFKKDSGLIRIWQEQRALYMESCVHLYIDLCTSGWILLTTRNIPNKICTGNRNHAACEIAGSRMAVWRIRFACSITKATDPLRICKTYCFSTAEMTSLTRFNVTLYVYTSAWHLKWKYKCNLSHLRVFGTEPPDNGRIRQKRFEIRHQVAFYVKVGHWCLWPDTWCNGRQFTASFTIVLCTFEFSQIMVHFQRHY